MTNPSKKMKRRRPLPSGSRHRRWTPSRSSIANQHRCEAGTSLSNCPNHRESPTTSSASMIVDEPVGAAVVVAAAVVVEVAARIAASGKGLEKRRAPF